MSIRSVFLNGVKLSTCPKISCQESVEVDLDLLRTVKQYLDMGGESGVSLHHGSLREFVSEYWSKQRRRKILRFFSPSEEGLPS